MSYHGTILSVHRIFENAFVTSLRRERERVNLPCPCPELASALFPRFITMRCLSQVCLLLTLIIGFSPGSPDKTAVWNALRRAMFEKDPISLAVALEQAERTEGISPGLIADAQRLLETLAPKVMCLFLR